VNGARGLVIAVLASFLVGCSMGLMGGILIARFVLHPPSPRLAWRHPEPGMRPRGPVLEMIERRLDVTAAQRARIEAILDSSRVAYAAVRESTHAALRRELRPEQRGALDRMEARIMRERRGGEPRPPWRMGRP
jgi:Spy/CpxP family protein refolding chaperone